MDQSELSSYINFVSNLFQYFFYRKSSEFSSFYRKKTFISNSHHYILIVNRASSIHFLFLKTYEFILFVTLIANLLWKSLLSHFDKESSESRSTHKLSYSRGDLLCLWQKELNVESFTIQNVVVFIKVVVAFLRDMGAWTLLRTPLMMPWFNRIQNLKAIDNCHKRNQICYLI